MLSAQVSVGHYPYGIVKGKQVQELSWVLATLFGFLREAV